MTVKYGVRTEWWKHLRHTKRPHWKAVRRLFKSDTKNILFDMQREINGQKEMYNV